MVSLGLAQGHSIRAMAWIFGRAPNTLNRELNRNARHGHPYHTCTVRTQDCGPILLAPAAAETDGRVVLLKGVRNRSAVDTLVECTTGLYHEASACARLATKNIDR